MLQSLKASRLPLAHVARQQALLQRRTFIAPTTALRADMVQDMYIRELKAYKPPPVKPSDSEGHVQTFKPPKAPKSPEGGDIASELKAYESQQPEVEGQAEESSDEVEDWFEEEPEEEAQSAH